MPYEIDPRIYGSANLYDLAVRAGTLQGEAGNQSVYGRAMVADNALNRAQRTSAPFFRNFDNWTSPDEQYSLSGASAQMMGPYQYSTWLASEGGAYRSATGMRDQIMRLGREPGYWDTLAPSERQQITMNLDALRGVFGSGDLRGIAGGATYYSTGNRPNFSETTWRQHNSLGLGDALRLGRVDGEAWYGDNISQVGEINAAIRRFDREPAARALTQRYDPNRPDDAMPGSPGVGGRNWWLDSISVEPPPSPGVIDRLNNFSDSLTEGVESLGRGASAVGQQAIDAIRGLAPGNPMGTASPAPGLFDFANGGTPGASGMSAGFGNGITPVDPGARGVDINSETFGQRFDPSAYLAANPDVRAAGMDPLAHFRMYGANEGRQPTLRDMPSQNALAVGPGNAVNGAAPNGTAFALPPGPAVSGAQPSASEFALAGGQGGTISPRGFAGNFDPSAYLAANRDVAAAGADPLRHWIEYGFNEGRGLNLQGDHTPIQPFDFSGRNVAQGAGQTGNGSFGAGISNTPASLSVNPIDAAYTTYLGRPAEAGVIQGVTSSFNAGSSNLASFEAQLRASPEAQAYLSAHPELAPTLASTNLARLYGAGSAQPGVSNFGTAPTLSPGPATSGVGPGRAVGSLPPGFDAQGYLIANPDVAAARVDPVQHYLEFGAAEGRSIGAPSATATLPPNTTGTLGALSAGVPVGAGQTINGLPAGSAFNAAEYLGANPDLVAAGITAQGALPHFTQYGFNEGRSLNGQGLRLDQDFSGTSYLAANQDVARLGLNPLEHYLQYGAKEGRGFTENASDPYRFGAFNNVSGGVPNGSFGSNITTLPLENVSTIAAPPTSSYIDAGATAFALPPANTASMVGAGQAVRGVPAGNAVTAWGGGGNISPFGFSAANVSGGVPNGSFGSMPTLPPPTYSAPATAGGFGGQGNIASAVNLGFGGEGFRPDAYNPTWDRPGFSGYAGSTNDASGAPMNGAIYGDGGTIQAQNSVQSQSNYFAIEANNRAIAEAQNAVAAHNQSIIGNPFGVEQLVVAQPFNPSGVASQGLRIEPAQALPAPRLNLPAQAQASNYAGPITSSYASPSARW